MKQGRLFAKGCNISCFSLGVVQFCFGFLLLLFFEPLYDLLIRTALDFSPGTETFKEWRTNDPPLIMDLYFFNWTNADQVYNGSVKPKFEEIGPYRYQEIKEKINITYNPNNHTMTYKYIKKYYFMEEESPRQLDDVLTLINLIPLSAAYKMRHSSYFMKLPLSIGLRMANLYETRTAREWIFDGFDEKILSTLHSVIDVQDKFGWFYGRNFTGPPDVINVHVKPDEDFGKIKRLNYRDRTDFFKGDCGKLLGSDGEFHPINSTKTNITIFSSEMCTYQTLYYEKEVDVKGIRAYKYSATHIFDNGTLVPENACYCSGECLPSGVLNISTCRQNAPVFLSLPHFYGADPVYRRDIEGLNPEKSKHEFQLTLEPRSSITVECAGRMQLNVLLQPISGIRMYENIPKRLMIPVFYFDQVWKANDTMAENVKMLQQLPEMSKNFSIILIVVGAVVMGLSTLLFAWLKPRKKPKLEMNYKGEVHEICPLKKNPADP